MQLREAYQNVNSLAEKSEAKLLGFSQRVKFIRNQIWFTELLCSPNGTVNFPPYSIFCLASLVKSLSSKSYCFM